MISQELYDMIQLGQPLYKVSSQNKLVRHAVVVDKLEAYQKLFLQRSFLVKFDEGSLALVTYLNGIEDGREVDPGWYLMV